MKGKILLITGDAGESYETLYAKHRFEEAEYEVQVAAPSKKILNLVIHDFEPGWDTYREAPGYKVHADLQFEEVEVRHFKAVLVLGGRAPEYLRHNTTVIQIIKEFDQQQKWIFSLCHGIQILIAADLVQGKRLTCYEHVRYELEMGGGTWQNLEAVRDDRIVSGQTWQSHPEFYREVFHCLNE